MFIIDFLKTVIEFIDKYDGAMIVFLTFVFAGITFFYLLETRKIREINQEMLKVSNTPDIQVSLSSDYWISDISSINLCIENIGTGFAYNVRFGGSFTSFRVTSKFILGETGVIKNGIRHLGPGKKYKIPVLFRVSEKNWDLPKEKMTAEVTYTDFAKNNINETFILDFSEAIGFTQLESQSLDSIAKPLRTISRNISNITRTYTSNSDE